MSVIKLCQHCCGTGDNLKKSNSILFEDDEDDNKREYLNRGFIEVSDNNVNKCPFCGHKLSNTGMPYKDFYLVKKLSKGNRVLLESFINLINNDFITYNLRIKEYESIEEKSKKLNTLQNSRPTSNIPKCPICGSTNLSKISGMKKAAKIGLFGIFGAGDLGKTWKCNNCGSKF